MKKARYAGLVGLTVSAALILAGCTGASVEPGGPVNSGATPGQDGCTPLVVATSSEKVNLMDELGAKFKESSQAEGLDTCASVFPINVSSGNGAKVLLSDPATWPELEEAYYPTIWSPASSVCTPSTPASWPPRWSRPSRWTPSSWPRSRPN